MRCTAQPLFKEKLGVGAYGERFLEQELGGFDWLRTVRRADGDSFEIGGISEEAADAYSYRGKEVRDRYRELEAEYVRDHGHAPGKQARWALKQRAALETRDAKEHNPPAPEHELAAWARKAERNGAGRLAALHEAVDAYAAEHAPSELPNDAERARAIRVAVAEVQRQSAVWSRAQLVFELGRALPTLPADDRPGGVPGRARRGGTVRAGRGRDRAAGRAGARRHRRDPARGAQGRDVGLPAAGRGDVLHRRAPRP